MSNTCLAQDNLLHCIIFVVAATVTRSVRLYAACELLLSLGSLFFLIKQARDSLISVVKTGESGTGACGLRMMRSVVKTLGWLMTGRPFELRWVAKEGQKQGGIKPFFSEV